MKVAFRKRAKSFYSFAIRLWTRGPYSHVELIFSDGRWFSSQEGEGVRYKSITLVPDKWDLIDIPIPSHLESEMRKACDKEEGNKYDWRGIAFSFLPIPIGWQHENKWFCSEICAAMLQIGGYLRGYSPASLSPNGLYRAIKKELEIPCVKK